MKRALLGPYGPQLCLIMVTICVFILAVFQYTSCGSGGTSIISFESSTQPLRAYSAISEPWMMELADSRKKEKPSLIVVLAGGVTPHGVPHESVLRRLDAALIVSRSAPAPVPILCNGGGTTHKTKWVDSYGFSTPEAHLMARYLVNNGVSPRDILVEGYSDDTLGNALMARTMIMQWMALKKVLIITSNFHLPRTKIIYEWAMKLSPGRTHTPCAVLRLTCLSLCACRRSGRGHG